jgi:TRAP-type transport system small permease protein
VLALNRFCASLARGTLVIAVLSLLVVTAIVGWQVFGRYVLNDTPVWAERTALLLMLYLCLFGAAVGVRDGGHMGMDYLHSKMSPAVKHRVIQLILLLTAYFGAAMAYYGFDLAQSVRTHTIPTLGISETWTYVPLVLSGAMIALFSIEHLIAPHGNAQDLIKGTE